jgi:FixJ family two-component response regulator
VTCSHGEKPAYHPEEEMMTLRLIESAPAERLPQTEAHGFPILHAHEHSDEIFIVDDDPVVRGALATRFTESGFRVKSFKDGDSFLALARTEAPACLILDIYMPGRSGLDVLDALGAEEYGVPVVVLTGRGDIQTAIKAIRLGAFDFIEKRWPAEAIVARVRQDLRIVASSRPKPDEAGLPPADENIGLLTPRERDVLKQILAAASTKETAITLGISPRTVEVHRAHILAKLGARSVADVARIVRRAKWKM